MILHSLFAIAAGFAVLAVLVALTTALFAWFGPPSWRQAQTEGPQAPSRASLWMNLLPSTLFPALGGIVTSFLAPRDPLIHALLLAIAVLVLAAVAGAELRGAYPISYRIALIALPPVAVVAGGIFEVVYR